MKRLINKNVSSIAGLFFLGLCSLASTVSAATSGPAPSSYGAATHLTTKWQELNGGINAGDSFGITWSLDGGATWGRDDLQVGQTVQFKFNMHKKNVGTHRSDHLKAWLDWNQNGVFEKNEVIAYGEHMLKPTKDTEADAERGNIGTNNTPKVPNITFLSGEYKIPDTMFDFLWLRARVTCSESIVKADGGSWDDQWIWTSGKYKSKFFASGGINQGETEDWKLNVKPAPVPVPAAVWLFGSGLAGMIGFSKRKKAA